MSLTPGQTNFITSLFNQAKDAAESDEQAMAHAETLLAPLADDIAAAMSGTLDKRRASRLIDALKDEVLPEIRAWVPVTEFRYRRPEHDEKGVRVFPISGPDGHDGDRVTVLNSKGGSNEAILSFYRKDGANTLYVAPSPKEMKRLDREAADAEGVKVAERCKTLLDRLDISKLYVAWESSGHNDLAFWQVTEARVAQVIGGHGRREVAGYEQAHAILDRLAEMSDEDIAAATALYGQELGHCGICGRELTDEDSRARGIGPKCAERGWL